MTYKTQRVILLLLQKFRRLQPTMPSFGGVIERTIVLTLMSGMVVFKLNHSADFPCHVTLTTTLFTPRFPVGILIPAPGHCFVSNACFRVLSFSAFVDLSAF